VDLCLGGTREHIELIDTLKSKPEKLGWEQYLSIHGKNGKEVRLWQHNVIGTTTSNGIVHGIFPFEVFIVKAHFLNSEFFVVETIQWKEGEICQYDFHIQKTFVFDFTDPDLDIEQYKDNFKPSFVISYQNDNHQTKISNTEVQGEVLEEDKEIINIEGKISPEDVMVFLKHSILYIMNKKTGTIDMFDMISRSERVHVNLSLKNIQDAMLTHDGSKLIAISEDSKAYLLTLPIPDFNAQAQFKKCQSQVLFDSIPEIPYNQTHTYLFNEYKLQNGEQTNIFITLKEQKTDFLIYFSNTGEIKTLSLSSPVYCWTLFQKYLFVLLENDNYEVHDIEENKILTTIKSKITDIKGLPSFRKSSWLIKMLLF